MKDELSFACNPPLLFSFYTSTYNIISPPLLLKAKSKFILRYTYMYICMYMYDIDISKWNFSKRKDNFSVNLSGRGIGSEITHPWLKVVPPLPFVNDAFLILDKFSISKQEMNKRRKDKYGGNYYYQDVCVYIFDDWSSFLRQNPDAGSIGSHKAVR